MKHVSLFLAITTDFRRERKKPGAYELLKKLIARFLTIFTNLRPEKSDPLVRVLAI